MLPRRLALLTAVLISAAAFAEETPAALAIRIVEGEGVVRTAGTRTLRPLTVEVTDPAGRPVPGATVSFRLPTGGPGGVFTHGLETDVASTGPDGRGVAAAVEWSTMPGTFSIRITAMKGEARAGAFVAQIVAATPAAARLPRGEAIRSRSRGKWIAFAVVAAGAVAGGFAAGLSSADKTQPPQPATPPAPQIGAPAITIGRP